MSSATKDPNPRPGKPFESWLENLHPDEREKLNDAMRTVLEAVETHNAKGEMALKLVIAKGTKLQVGVIPAITIKTPRPKMDSQTFWLAPGMDLATEDPRQQKLPLNRTGRLALFTPPKDGEGGDDTTS